MGNLAFKGLVWLLSSVCVVFMGAAIASGSELEWSYEGSNGPEAWGGLSAAFSACEVGLAQSPINIDPTAAAHQNEIEFTYGRAPLNIANNGRTIRVNVSAANTIKLGDEDYVLQQFHFHRPSEHIVSGEPYAMEMHLVHQNAAGDLMVVGIFLTEGAENSALTPVWQAMPQGQSPAQDIAGVEIDVEALLPANLTQYRYDGSLTTPPCSEPVKWVIMATPVEVSATQIEQFSSIIPPNARPIQPLNHRFSSRADG
ncbi:MAG: carbonic anhydrase family protein [Cyanobacteria bacterium P01_C01_bin.120]